MDIYREQIVSKNPTKIDTLKKICVGFTAILLAVILFLLSGFFNLTFIGLVLAGGCIYFGFYLISNFDTEYEYIVTGGEIDIDKIIAKRKRKRLISVKASSFIKFGLLKDAPLSQDITLVIASGKISGDDYYAEFNHSAHGQVRLIFSPNERTLEAIKPYIPRTIR